MFIPIIPRVDQAIKDCVAFINIKKNLPPYPNCVYVGVRWSCDYQSRKWNWQRRFKFWLWLFHAHFRLIPLGNSSIAKYFDRNSMP